MFRTLIRFACEIHSEKGNSNQQCLLIADKIKRAVYLMDSDSSPAGFFSAKRLQQLVAGCAVLVIRSLVYLLPNTSLTALLPHIPHLPGQHQAVKTERSKTVLYFRKKFYWIKLDFVGGDRDQDECLPYFKIFHFQSRAAGHYSRCCFNNGLITLNTGLAGFEDRKTVRKY